MYEMLIVVITVAKIVAIGFLLYMMVVHNREILAYRIIHRKLIVDSEQNAAVNLDLLHKFDVIKDRVTFLEHQANGNGGMHEEPGNFHPGPKG